MAGGFRRLIRGETRIDFVGRSKLWATISAIVIVGSTIALFTPGLKTGLEFAGGTALQVPVAGDEVTVTEVDEALAGLDTGGEVQVKVLAPSSCEVRTTSGSCQVIEVRATELDPNAQQPIKEALAEVAGQPNAGEVSGQSVGKSWGDQVTKKMIRALLVFLVLVTIYISMRFEPKMAAGALAALLHDLIATAGIYALTGLTVSPATVIAVLTLMGFSLYDTVVVFDRVKENADKMSPRERYGDMVNRSMNEVLIRSINTSISSILPVAGLLFVGVFLFNAETLKDLAVAMFIGTAVSIYSSIFVASPILAALKEREPRYRQLRERASAGATPSVRTARAGATTTAVKEPPVVEPEFDTPPTPPPASTPRSGDAINRPIRPRRKGRR